MKRAAESDQADDDLTTLFSAAAHACKAERFQDAYHKYDERIQLGQQWRAAFQLGQTACCVSALSHFFDGGEFGKWSPQAHQQLTAQQRLNLLTQAGTLCTAMRGYADRDVRHCYEAAEALAGSENLPLDRYLSVRGSWRAQLTMGNIGQASVLRNRLEELGSEILRLPDPLLSKRAIVTSIADCSAGTYFFHGQFEDSYKLALRGIDDDERQRWLSDIRHFLDVPAIVARTYQALSMWFLGMDEALDCSEQAVREAEPLGIPHAYLLALGFHNLIHHLAGSPDSFLEEIGQKMLDRATRQRALFFSSAAHCFLGAVRARQAMAKRDQKLAEKMLVEIDYGISSWCRSGARLILPFYQSLKARTLAQLGRHHEAIRLTRKTIQDAKLRDENWWLAGLHLCLGDCLTQAGVQHERAARREYDKGRVIADKQKAVALLRQLKH